MVNYFPVEDEQPWTTARCNRLLRPISSRLTILRKALLKQRLIEAAEKPPIKLPAKRKSIPDHAAREYKPGVGKGTDPDWVPIPRANGLSKRTYRGRPAKVTTPVEDVLNQPQPTRPGEISVPTPFISRSLGRLQDSPQVIASPLQLAGKRNRRPLHSKPTEYLQTLKKEMTPDLWKQVDGLYEGFSNLLQATKKPSGKSRKGTRSLMSSCLRQVPRYIALEEEWLAEDGWKEDDDHNITDEVYTDLESLGTCEGQGWRHLREVVRAHAMALLCDAIENRILELSTVQGLYRLCMNASAWDEAEAFLDSYMSVHKPIIPPSSHDSDLFDGQISPCLTLVNDFVGHTWRYQFLYDQLRFIVGQQILPPEWLATRSMLPLWSRIVRTLSDRGHRTYANAVEFLETAVCIGSGLPIRFGNEVDLAKRKPQLARAELRDALTNTFSSLFTLLASINLVSHTRAEETDEATVRSVSWVLEYMATNILSRDDMRGDIELFKPHADNVNAFSQRALCCLAAPFLVQLGGSSLEQGMPRLSLSERVSAFSRTITSFPSENSATTSTLDILPTFVSSIARCSGKAWKDDGFDQLQRLVEVMISANVVQESQTAWTLKRLALDAALEFAEGTKDAEHFSFARKLEKNLRSSQRILPAKSPTKGLDSPEKGRGFRWEEGIGEWVICTPFAKQQVKRIPLQPTSSLVLPPTPTDSECDMEDLRVYDNNEEFVHTTLPVSPGTPISEPSSPFMSSPLRISDILANPNRKATLKRSLDHRPRQVPKRPRLTSAATDELSAADDSDANLSCVESETVSAQTNIRRSRPQRDLQQGGMIIGMLGSDRVVPSRRTERASSSNSDTAINWNIRDSSYRDTMQTHHDTFHHISGTDEEDPVEFKIVNHARSHTHKKSRSANVSFIELDESEDELAIPNQQRRKQRATLVRTSSMPSLRKQISTRSLKTTGGKADIDLDDSDDELSFS